MTVYEPAKIEERGDLIDFANMVFSVAHRPHDFKKMLPKVYGDGAPLFFPELHFIERTDGRVRALVAMLPVRMNIADEPLTAGFVGTVSVHPHHRGRGSMRELMRMTIDEARRRRFAYLALGGQRQRYEYFGFSPAGLRASHEIRPANIRHALKDADASGISFKTVGEADGGLIADIHAIYETRPVRGARPPHMFHTICRSWGNELTAALSGGKCIGALIGDDREICELILADAKDAPRVIKAWFEYRKPDGAQLLVPMYDTAIQREIGAFSESVVYQEEVSICVLDWVSTLEAYAALKHGAGAMTDGRWTFAVNDQPSITIEVRGGRVDVAERSDAPSVRLSQIEAQRAIFSPMALAAPLPGAPVGWFPLPLGFGKPDQF
ncbi:MAG: GNAT family N-acetyltransferase [Oscillospiraceae bacterium]|jgi:predicted N-acetyltransferase YhbS|nr:GNAT family N-acetyltransferase [Oscillospiraceae bacterium]